MIDDNSDNMTVDGSTDTAEMKEVRRRNPTGWLAFTDDEAMRFAIDALVDLPPGTEFVTSDLAERAGLTEEDTERCVERLLEMGFLERSAIDSSLRLDEHSQVADAIFTLNGAMIAARSEDAELAFD